MPEKDSSISTDVKEGEETETTEETTNEEVVETDAEVEAKETEKENRENQRVREAVEEKNHYKRMLDLALSQGSNKQVQTVVDEVLPEIDPEVQKVIDRKSAKMNEQYSGIVSAMGEKLDDLESRDTIPNYKKHKAVIEAHKDEYVKRTGRWINRYQAYAYLLAEGTIKAPKEETVVVNKAKTRVVTETKTNSGGRSAGAKEFSKMNLAEKEEYLKDKNF